MQPYVPWIVTALALVALVLLLSWQNLVAVRRRPAGPPPLPVAWDLLPRPVFSADERRMYRQLQEALPHHVVLAKLPLVRFCQPTDPTQVRFWYELLGAIHVNFAVCSINGRVLAAIDLNYERTGPPSRATRIKQSVLGACRIRYLRCAPDHLPSIPELQLLVPQAASAARGPQPAPPYPGPGVLPPTGRGLAFPQAPAPRRRERSTLWSETMEFNDSFFAPGARFESSGMGELRPLHDLPSAPGDPAGTAHAPPPPLRH
jgi:Protein of unknown function (DUF2726)